MNVNDLHPKFQLDLDNEDRYPDINKPSDIWNIINLYINPNEVYSGGATAFTFVTEELPTKNGANFNLATGILTVLNPAAALPSRFFAHIKLGSLVFAEVTKISFTFSDMTSREWTDNQAFEFIHIPGTNDYRMNNNDWVNATKIKAIARFSMALELPKDIIMRTQSLQPSILWYKTLYFNYYPSGLIVQAEVKGTNVFACNLQKHYLKDTGSDGNLLSIKFLSPTPKIYCFFTSDTGASQWVLTGNSWSYNAQSHFWEQTISFSQAGDKYYFNSIPSQVSFNKMLFIDSMLWGHRDNHEVNADQTADDVALYPICKVNNSNTYYLNRTNLTGTYNFLTSYGALYMYPDQINKLKEAYVTIDSEEGTENLEDTIRERITLNNLYVTPVNGQGWVHRRFGSVKDKAIMHDDSFSNSDDRITEDDNSHLPANRIDLVKSNKKTLEHPYVFFENFTNNQNVKDYTNSFLVDEYHTLIGNTMYRHPAGMKFAFFSRTNSRSLSTAWENGTSRNDMKVGPNSRPFAFPNSETPYWSNFDVFATTGQSYVEVEPSYYNGEHETVINEFVYDWDSYDCTEKALTIHGWENSSFNVWVSKNLEFRAGYNIYLRHNGTHGGSLARVQLGTSGTNRWECYLDFIFVIPHLSFLSNINKDNTFTYSCLDHDWGNVGGNEKWIYPESPAVYGDTYSGFSYWCFNNKNNSSKVGLKLNQLIECKIRGIAPTSTYNFINGYGYYKYSDIYAPGYDGNVNYDGYSFDWGDKDGGNYSGLSSTFKISSDGATAVCVIGYQD